ncbi:MAG: YicC family protein [Saprospiraceae bacterium]|nr:YicC family protein [Saprospiraceae bacterium]
MTGFGSFSGSYKTKNISVEVRALNSKFTDLRLKIPQSYRELEPQLRKILLDELERGKIDFVLTVQSLAGDDNFSLNTALFKRYFHEFEMLSQELGLINGDMLQAILRLPNVVNSNDELVGQEEWEKVQEIIQGAIKNLKDHRLEEGAAMESDLKIRVNNITRYLGEVSPFEADRIEKLRQRIWNNLGQYIGNNNVDENRFEQEVLFYLEKLDITEEKVRLEQHCKYFLDQLNDHRIEKGRQLNFISQEMGREINTMGAKANSSDIQKLVVLMKDDLEKIKEMVANSV